MRRKKPKPPSRSDRIRSSAEALFGAQVVEVSAPGGKGRASLRFHFGDRSVIGTLRPNFRRTHLEAYVLRALEPYCDDIPRCLGVDGEIMFQSDVGGRRLNQEIGQRPRSERAGLAAEAVSSILRIHAAARKTDLHRVLPHLGANPAWIDNLLAGTETLVSFSRGLPAQFDAEACRERLNQPGHQFVKWDCRAGNAAIGADGKLRWFDFEYAGLRHGAEDLAWLIADESWPIGAETMLAITRDALPGDTPGGRDSYMEYLSVFTTFHALQRLKLIVSEAHHRGWLRIADVLARDDAGVHPAMAAHLCHNAAITAQGSKLTASLAPLFEETATVFETVLKKGRA